MKRIKIDKLNKNLKQILSVVSSLPASDHSDHKRTICPTSLSELRHIQRFYIAQNVQQSTFFPKLKKADTLIIFKCILLS